MGTTPPSPSSAAYPARSSTTTPSWRSPASLATGTRQRTQRFSELLSHYLFEPRFGRPGRGNDKGKVENLVGFTRRNFLVPVPRFASFEALNDHLEACCRERLTARLRGHQETIAERQERDKAALLALPATPYEARERVSTRVNSLSLVRYLHEVVISCAAEVIARHPRSYEREDFLFDPLQYLPLLEQKVGALDQAAPLVGWHLPEPFEQLYRLLQARLGKPGKREYVQVLRLLESFSLEVVHAAIAEALRLGAIGYDAIKPPRLDLSLYPYLPRAQVQTTSPADYQRLLHGEAP